MWLFRKQRHGVEVRPVDLTGGSLTPTERANERVRGREVLITAALILLAFFGGMWVISLTMPPAKELAAAEGKRLQRLSEICFRIPGGKACDRMTIEADPPPKKM